MKEPIQFSVQIDKITSKKDRTIAIVLGTQEMSPEDASRIFELHNMQIWCALSETSISQEDIHIPDVVPEFKKDKSPSERLRARMYVYFTNKHDSDEGFTEWYSRALDKIGDSYLAKINP